jgi:hypothetical protein
MLRVALRNNKDFVTLAIHNNSKQISILEVGSENVDWDCLRRFEFCFLIRVLSHVQYSHNLCREVANIANTVSKPKAPANADAVFTNRSRQLHSTLIHHAPPITPTMMRNVNIPAPALSLVVIGFVGVSGCVLGDVVPAFGSLTEVPPVFFVKGTMAGVKRFVPITLRAAIWEPILALRKGENRC